jgi:hypothetical protein
MRFFLRFGIGSMALLFLALSVPVSHGQVINSASGTVTITANLSESLTVNVTSGTAITVPLVANTAGNAGTAGSSVTTAWVLKPGRTSVALWAYFTSATAALVHQTAGNPSDIPSSAVKIQVGGAGAFNALTNVSPFNAAASGLQIGTATNITGTNKNSSRTDTLAYQVDTTVVPQLPADSYVGTLNIQAQATP